MERLFLLLHVFTGHPASGSLLLFISGFQCSVDLTNSFNKRGGETVHLTTGPHGAAVHDPRNAAFFFHGSRSSQAPAHSPKFQQERSHSH